MADQQQIQRRKPVQPGRGKPPARAQDPLGQHRIQCHGAFTEPQQELRVPKPGQPAARYRQRREGSHWDPRYPLGRPSDAAFPP